MTILAILLKASLLLCAGALAQVLLARRASASARHLLWTLVVLALLVLPLVAVALPAWVRVDVGATSAATVVATAAAPVARFAADLMPDDLRPPVNLAGVSPVKAISWPTVAGFVYGLGVFVLLLRLVVQRWSVDRLFRRATPVTDVAWMRLIADGADLLGVRRRVRVSRSLDQTMPMAVGTRHPTILIPAAADDWSDDRRRSVVLHELAHVARYDCLIQMLAAIACAMYWVHPGVWWVARRLRIERELACDDRVLSAGADPNDYAGDLLEIAYALKSDVAPALAVTMAAPRQLESRLRALLDERRKRRPPQLRSRCAGIGIAVVLVAAVAGARVGDSRVHAFTPAREPLLPIQDSPRQTFEVASVKPSESTETGGFIQRRPGGNFAVGNQTLQRLILFAYQLQGFQLVGSPGWITTARFDIVAKAATDIPPTPSGSITWERLMLRALLGDRFRLAMHRETRDMPIYALIVARNDGRLGPQIRRPSTDYCAQRLKESLKGNPQPFGTGPVCGISGNDQGLTAGAFPISEFVGFLSNETRRIVVDRTGLTGVWDFDLKWSPANAPSTDPDRPSIFTALQEQLGLRLDATTGPVEVLVIDRVEALIPD